MSAPNSLPPDGIEGLTWQERDGDLPGRWVFACECDRAQGAQIGQVAVERIGWRRIGGKWTCPFCTGNTSNLDAAFGKAATTGETVSLPVETASAGGFGEVSEEQQAAELGDLRVCLRCANKATGYTFVASVQGIDASVCPDSRCKRRGFAPWTENFDSIEDALKYKKPGRNEPCPCGSGKKLKKCKVCLAW